MSALYIPEMAVSHSKADGVNNLVPEGSYRRTEQMAYAIKPAVSSFDALLTLFRLDLLRNPTWISTVGNRERDGGDLYLR